MGFDVDAMTDYCLSELQAFAARHTDETFYAFAVDGSLLCLNSEEGAAKVLEEYQEKWDRQTSPVSALSEFGEQIPTADKFSLELAEKYSGLDRADEHACLAVINERRSNERSKGCPYRSPDGVKSLRENTGDWVYQGFSDLANEDAFDRDLYDAHYEEAMDSDDGHAPGSEYAIAMNQLLDALKTRRAFNCLRVTTDFKAEWGDHDY